MHARRWCASHGKLLLLHVVTPSSCACFNMLCRPGLMTAVFVQQQRDYGVQAAEADEWLPSVLHDTYYRWHESLCTGLLSSAPGATSGGDHRPSSVPLRTASRQAGLAALQTAPRGLLAAALVTGPEAATPVGVWPARLLQLKLAARHLGRCCSLL